MTIGYEHIIFAFLAQEHKAVMQLATGYNFFLFYPASFNHIRDPAVRPAPWRASRAWG